MSEDVKWTDVTDEDQVTEEILKIAEGVIDGWYSTGPIDWDDVWDRIDGAPLDDGTKLNIGNDLSSPVIMKLEAHIKNYRNKSRRKSAALRRAP